MQKLKIKKKYTNGKSKGCQHRKSTLCPLRRGMAATP